MISRDCSIPERKLFNRRERGDGAETEQRTEITDRAEIAVRTDIA
jgi:hypothetical protein